MENCELPRENREMGPNESNVFPKAKEKGGCVNSFRILKLGKIRYTIIVSHV